MGHSRQVIFVFAAIAVVHASPMPAAQAPICQAAPSQELRQVVMEEGSTNISFDPRSSGAIGSLVWEWDARLKGARIFIVSNGASTSTAYVGRDTATGADYFGPSPYIRLTVRNGKYTLTKISDVPGNLVGGSQEVSRNQDEVRAGTAGSVSLTPVTFLNDQHTEAVITCGSDSVVVERPSAFVPDERRESLGPWIGDDGYRYDIVVNAKGEGYDVNNVASSRQSPATLTGYKVASPNVMAELAKVHINVPQALSFLGIAAEKETLSTPQAIITPDATISAGSFGANRQFLFVSAGALNRGNGILTAALTYAISTQIMYAYPALLNQTSDEQSLDRIASALLRNNSALLITLLEAKQKELPSLLPAVPRTSPPPAKAIPEIQGAMGRLFAKMPDPGDRMAFARALRTSMSSGNVEALEQFRTTHQAFSNDADLKTVEGTIDPHAIPLSAIPNALSNRTVGRNQVLGGEHVPTNAYPADLLSNVSERSELIRRFQQEMSQ
jgi:hypothetical protein